MKKVLLILGNITFLDPQIDNEHKAIVHSISGAIEFDDENTATQVGEDLVNICDSYLVLPTYKGQVVFECEEPRFLAPVMCFAGQPKDTIKENLIEAIQAIICDWGAFTTADVQAEASPVIATIGETSQLVENFLGTGGEVVTYVHETETNTDFVSYENMELNVLQEIYQLALVHEKMGIEELNGNN